MARGRRTPNRGIAARVAGPLGKRRNNLQPTMRKTSRDSSIVSYNAVGGTVARPTTGWSSFPVIRMYAPGLVTVDGQTMPAGIGSCAGRDIVRAYSTAKFLPGTKLTWTPSVGFTAPGRVFVGFTDNPEVALHIYNEYKTESMETTPDFSTYANYVKNLGDVVSHQVFEEFTVQVPTRLRRKMFDTNEAFAANSDTMDRCGQTFMFAILEGVEGAGPWGSFMYHDTVQVEGVRPTAAT